MKTIRVLLLLSLSIFFFSCSDDDDKQSIPRDHPILGTWVLSDYRAIIGTSNSSLDRILKDFIMEEYYSDNPAERGSTVTFNENGKATLVSYPDGETSEVSFKIDAETVTLIAGGEQQTTFYSITEDNRLVLTTDLLKACKIYAIHLGYNDEVYEAEFDEEYRRLD